VKTVRYRGPGVPPITIAAPDGNVVTDDQGVAEVDDDLAKSLLDQDIWESQTKTAAKAATKED